MSPLKGKGEGRCQESDIEDGTSVSENEQSDYEIETKMFDMARYFDFLMGGCLSEFFSFFGTRKVSLASIALTNTGDGTYCLYMANNFIPDPPSDQGKAPDHKGNANSSKNKDKTEGLPQDHNTVFQEDLNITRHDLLSL